MEANAQMDWTDLSKDARKKRVHEIYIDMPQIRAIEEQIAKYRAARTFAAEPKCLLVKGHPGVGKSTLIGRILKKNPRYRTAEGTQVPVFVSEAPTPPSIGGIASKMLKDLGASTGGKTVERMTDRLVELVEACGVELTLLDEFQHFTEHETDSMVLKVSDWLKMYLNMTRVPLVLFGLHNCTRVLDVNPALRDRFSAQVTIEPFSWDTEEARREFKTFLWHVDAALPLPERSKLANDGMAFRLFRASSGFLRRAMKILRSAAELAIDGDRPCLDLELLALAYLEEVQRGTPGGVNPFSCDEEDLTKVRPPEPEPIQSKATNNRTGNAKGRRKKVSAVLSQS